MTQDIKRNEPDAKIVYADIISLPHWRSVKHKHMSSLDRAAQFSSFAALTGYEDMIEEEAREVGNYEELSETEMEILSQKINLINDVLENGHHPILQFTYFLTDALKEGGSYVSITERVRRIDPVRRKIQLYKSVGSSKSYMELDMDKIHDINGALVDHIE